MKFSSPEGATPIDPDTLHDLIPSLATQVELNEFEAANISKAMEWADRSRKLKGNLLSISGLRLLHERMFDETWKWAGKFRRRELNIGIEPSQIQPTLASLMEDVKYWLENKTYSLDEIAVRFHYRIVKIHPFLNGNGRLGRLSADLLMEFHGGEKFSWGAKSLTTDSDNRAQYLKFLREADKTGGVKSLLRFARS